MDGSRPDRTVAALALLLVLAAGAVLSASTVAAQTTTPPNCDDIVDTYEGEGTTSDPYEITNVSQLQCVWQRGDAASFELTSDIDASGTSEWEGYQPVREEYVGDGFKPIESFGGSIEGAGHEITNLTIYRPEEDTVALVDELSPAGEVRNITLTDVDIRGNVDVGGLVGSNQGTVIRSSSEGNVNGSFNVGGLVGENYGGNIEKSYAIGTVRGFGQSAVEEVGVGGLVGLNYKRANLAGEGPNGTVKESYAAAEAFGDSGVGGLVGVNDDGGVVEDSYWDANLATYSGGGVGLTTEEMTGSAAESNMSGFSFGNTWGTVTNPDDYPVLIMHGGDGSSRALSPDNPFADQTGDPLGELEVVDRLVSWSDDSEVGGVEYGELEMVDYLVNWNEVA